MEKIQIKVVLLGSASAGKTCLLERFMHGAFQPVTQATIAGAFSAKCVEIDGTKVFVKCWDTAGSERYMSVSRMYYRGAVAAILCFDLTDRQSFNRTRMWVTELRNIEEKCKLYICGTKKDLIDKNPGSRAVPEVDARQYAADLIAEYTETSSVTGENIDELFTLIATNALAQFKQSTKRTGDVQDSIKVSSWRKDSRVKTHKNLCCKN